jgi:diguanylate cyclase (GGDEF)-like protein
MRDQRRWARRPGRGAAPFSSLLVTSGRAFGLMFVTGAAVGLAAMLVPHGRYFSDATDVVISTIAGLLGVLAWRRKSLKPLETSLLLVLGTAAVSVGVYSGKGDYVSVSAAVIYIWLALIASLFLSPRRTWAHVGLIAASYAIVLSLDGNSGAPAEWLFVIGTASVATVVTLAIRKELTRTSEQDPLTGLPNRAGLDRALARELARARREGSRLALGVLDLDDFKRVNDQRGHLAADEVLVETVRLWRQSLWATDVLARFGGDEFVVLLPSAGDREAQEALRRMHSAGVQCGFSAGLAVWDGAESAMDLIGRADEALYQAKRLDQPNAVVMARASAYHGDKSP